MNLPMEMSYASRRVDRIPDVYLDGIPDSCEVTRGCHDQCLERAMTNAFSYA
jgi:hypothetical protein